VSLNEEVDPAAIIRRQKQEVRDLKDELQLLKGGAAQRGPLTPDELLRLRQQLLAFVADSSAGASLNLGGDMMIIRASECDCWAAHWCMECDSMPTLCSLCSDAR
jgi:rhamnose utilization protein RhaD (predicted bifunctional aldolase and dehydrogenase)